VMAKDTRKMAVTSCPTYGEFFERFMKGMHKRMGEIIRPDRALPVDVLKVVMAVLDKEWEESNTFHLAIAREASFYLITFCCALRGEEVVLTDLFGTQKYWEQGSQSTESHVVVALLGRFKGETGEVYHLLPIVSVTNRGLEPRKWIGRLLTIYQNLGINHGPLFRTQTGQRMKARDFEPKFFDRLEYVKAVKPHLLNSVEDVSEEFGVFRSFRRGATSEAVNAGLTLDIIEENNRWRKFHKAGASKPG
jgi:hypothetical protein